MNTSEVIQVKETIKLSPQMEWVNRNFVQNQPKCVQSNSGVFICTHKKCTKENPFICNTLNCQCRDWHNKCPIFNIQSFIDEFQTRNDSFSTQLQKTIEQSMDKLIETISIAKESFLQRIRQRKTNQLLKKNQQLRKKGFNELLKKKLTGSLIDQLTHINQKNVNDRWLMQFNKQFAEIFSQFERIKLKPFLQHADSVLFSDVGKVCWGGYNYKSSNMIVSRKEVKRDNYTCGQLRMTLLQQGMSKLSGSIIKWRIKILNISNCDKIESQICLGVCLRQSIRRKDFKLNDRNDQSYMISNKQKIYDVVDFEKNGKNGFGIEFKSYDTIQMELDKINWIIKFQNLRTLKSTKLKIARIPQPNEDDYHICVAMNNRDDKVQIISPIQTSLHSYELSN